ncbi:MAG: hypothetical protein KR126chlam1_01474 [Chlamydiae bacterium]|nr:hypothetical protein [Chlamydiota bacterium]
MYKDERGAWSIRTHSLYNNNELKETRQRLSQVKKYDLYDRSIYYLKKKKMISIITKIRKDHDYKKVKHIIKYFGISLMPVARD